MKYYKIDPRNPDKEALHSAIECLEQGGVIVYPTDTLYGMGVDVFNRDAVRKLYMIKERDMRRPVSIMMQSLQQVKEVFGFRDQKVRQDLDLLLPGRITAIIDNVSHRRVPILEDVLKPGDYQKTVGIRIPDHVVCNRLSDMFDSPISTTSANISGQGNAFSIEEIVAQLSSKPDLILDAGPIEPSKGSTVIDMSREPYLILREGDVNEAELKKKLGRKRVQVPEPAFRITFICSGNICRSPMAEAILKRMISKTKYRDQIDVQSAGTLPLTQQPAHDYAINVCDENGIDITRHRSRPVTREIVNNSHLILCMAQDHLAFFNKNYPNERQKVALLKQWKRDKQLSIPSIADPIGHNYPFFKETFEEIREELKRVLPPILAEVRAFAKSNGR